MPTHQLPELSPIFIHSARFELKPMFAFPAHMLRVDCCYPQDEEGAQLVRSGANKVRMFGRFAKMSRNGDWATVWSHDKWLGFGVIIHNA